VVAFCRRAGKKSVFAAGGNPDFELRTSRIKFARDHWIYEYGLRNVDRIVVQNEEQARLCRLNFGRDATQVPNCYPAAHSRPAEAGRFVLWVSTIRALKRPELFLDLAEALPSYRFRMIGGPGRGEAPLFDAIKARAATIANAEFIGFVPYARVNDYFDDASVFVNTSESEGFPNTFLQAWARGVPTVSFVDSGARAGGHPVGRQVDSFRSMVDQLAVWLANGAERAREGQRCKRYFEDNHSPAQVIELYEQIFRELVPRGA
jgi:glycosyltransferase involved in cell wall biosynthesis